MDNCTRNFYISGLHAEEVRLFKKIDVKFNSGFNFIIGPNGTGKTSLLRCLGLCVSHEQFQDSRYGDKTCVWLDFIKEAEIVRVGQGLPQPGTSSWIVSRGYMDANYANNFVPPKEGASQVLGTWDINNKIPFFAPLFIGAYRKINYSRIEGMRRESQIGQSRETYRSTAASSLTGSHLPAVKQWMINRYFAIEKDWAITEKENWQWLVNNMKYLSPQNIDFSFKEIRQDLEPQFTLSGQDCYLEELSAGFQSILSLVLAIFEWIESVNENSQRYVRNAQGTVIIDELDAHMHPEWQFTIRETLERIFPCLQFIITTHSPHLLATAKYGEILEIPIHNGIVNIEPKSRVFSGWNTDQILEEVMGVTNLKAKLYQQLLDKAICSIEQKNIPDLEKAINALEEVVHPNDTVVTVFKIKHAKLLLETEQ